MEINIEHAKNIDNNENVKYIYEYLRNLKDKNGKPVLSPQHVAGIMGNMYQESHFNPEASSGKYKGLVQMSPGLWSYYETYLNNNKLTNTVPNQLKYLGEIFTNRSNHSPFGIEGQHIYRNEWGGFGRQDKFITTPYKTAGEAAAAFADLFERQGANDTSSRSNYADYIYGTYNYKQGGILKRVSKKDFGESTRNSSAPFVRRLLNGNHNALINKKGERETHLMTSSDNYIFPMVQEQNGELIKFNNWEEALNNAITNNNVIIAPNKHLAKWYGKNYKQFFPEAEFKNGGKIHIKPENKGKFTALKKRTGKSSTWYKEHGTPSQKKMAVFALNAKKWNHGK